MIKNTLVEYKGLTTFLFTNMSFISSMSMWCYDITILATLIKALMKSQTTP